MRAGWGERAGEGSINTRASDYYDIEIIVIGLGTFIFSVATLIANIGKGVAIQRRMLAVRCRDLAGSHILR